MDTIFALSSGALPAALGIVRISGPGARAALGRLTLRPVVPRHATLATLTDPADGSILDDALVLLFPAPASATGEDVVELQCHGGKAVIAGVLDALAAMPGLRAAEPGEFTRRAFLAGRMDLTAVEGLGDLLAAETALQRRQAQRLIEGGLSRRIEALQEALLLVAARIEAAIDYAEEGAETEADEADICARLTELAGEMQDLLAAPPAERLRDGIRVVLAGSPNAGKSTLLNALAGRDVAIVSPHAGTTRDRIEAAVVRAGIPFVLTDTAGLRTTDDAIERIGIARANDAIEEADILVWLDPGAPAVAGMVVAVHAKADLGGAIDPARTAVSALQTESIDRLWEALVSAAGALLPPADAISLNLRQRTHLADAAWAIAGAAGEHDLVVIAAEVRIGLNAFDRLTGRAGVDDMLAALFGRFCVGK